MKLHISSAASPLPSMTPKPSKPLETSSATPETSLKNVSITKPNSTSRTERPSAQFLKEHDAAMEAMGAVDETEKMMA